VLNQTTNQIVAYYVKAGTLTMIGSYTTPATPVTLTVAPDDSFLYLSTANGIYLYNIGSDGALTLENSSSAISSDMAQAMQVDSTNTWLVESVSGLSEVYAIPISASTGLPSSHTEQYAVLPSTNIQQLTISPDNSYVFVAMGTGGTAVIPFTAGNTNPFGTVGNIPVKNSSGAALSVAVDPTDRLFYIGETNATSATNSGGLRVFKYSSLPSVAELSASPYASQGLAPYSIVPISTGGYVYVVNRQVSGSSTGVIAGYAIASSGSTYTHPEAMVEDSTDQFLFVVNYGGSYDLMGYTFDSTNAGYLDSAVSSTTGTDPVGASAIAAIH
jgi:hypothetical protein